MLNHWLKHYGSINLYMLLIRFNHKYSLIYGLGWSNNWQKNVITFQNIKGGFYFAVECPFGTYWSGGFCVMCPKGYFQDTSRQLSCKTCPVGYSTQFIASRNESECTGKSKL